MSLFVVEQEKCKRDGVCVAEYPIGIIELKRENAALTQPVMLQRSCGVRSHYSKFSTNEANAGIFRKGVNKNDS